MNDKDGRRPGEDDLMDLGLALHRLERSARVYVADAFLRHVEDDIQSGGYRGRLADDREGALPYPVTDTGEAPPWSVHLADAQDSLEDVRSLPLDADVMVTARLASIISEGVAALRAAAWAASDPEDFRRRDLGQESRGMYENIAATEEAAEHRMKIRRFIQQLHTVAGRTVSDGFDPEELRAELRRAGQEDDYVPDGPYPRP